MSDFEMPYFVDGGGNKGYFKDVTARENITDVNEQITGINNELDAIHPSERIISSPILEMHGPEDKPIRIYETGDEDYKAICIYDKNNVERYALRFAGGHLFFLSKDANGNIIVSQNII